VKAVNNSGQSRPGQVRRASSFSLPGAATDLALFDPDNSIPKGGSKMNAWWRNWAEVIAQRLAVAWLSREHEQAAPPTVPLAATSPRDRNDVVTAPASAPPDHEKASPTTTLGAP
jgi:hypothetical protein